MKKVYLAGPFHSNWQKEVKEHFALRGEFTFLDPRENWVNKTFKHPSEYWPWNIQAIKEADIVFVYVKDYETDVFGCGHIFEMGVATALGKLVILVNEIDHRYFTQYDALPNVVYFTKLKEGINYLLVWKRFGKKE